MRSLSFASRTSSPSHGSRMFVKAWLVPVVAALTALPLQAATFLIDFGPGNQTTPDGSSAWNNFTGLSNGAALLNLRDINGVSFDYDLTYTGATLSTLGDNDVSRVIDDTPAPFNLDTVIAGSLFNPTTGTFTLSNLDPALSYNFTFYAYIKRDDSRRTRFTINGTFVDVEPGNIAPALGGKGETGSINNVSPDASGNIVFTVDRSPNGGGNWIFNGAQITSVPEPSTALLALAGAAGFCGFRRRNR